MGYLKNTLKGLSWLGSLRAITRLLALLRTGLLARLLTPAQFGFFGIASLVLAFLEVLTETGINIFLIQEKQSLSKYLNTAWLISILRGITIALLIFFSAPLIASFFHTPQAKNLLLLISLVPLIKGFINPAIIKFKKNLEFNKEFWLRTSLFFGDSLIAVSVALITRSPASLIWGFITSAVLEVFFSQFFIKPRPKLAPERGHFQKIIKRGRWVTANRILSFFSDQGDDAVVGKILNPRALGQYQIAYKLSLLPGTEISEVISNVTLPIFTRLEKDKKRLKKAIVKTLIGAAFLVIPVSLILFFFAQEIVLIVLGKNWLEVAPVLKILSIFGGIGSLMGLTHAPFYSLKHQDWVAKIALVRFLTLALIILPLIQKWGLSGAAWACLIAVLAEGPLVAFYLKKIL